MKSRDNENKRKGEGRKMPDVNETSQLSLESEESKKEGVDLDQAEQKTEISQEDLQKIKDKLKEVENQYLRVLADYQNLQKRSSQEKEDLYRYAAEKTIEILLPALDTFEYARQTVKPDSKPEKIIEDFSLVFEMLLKCLKDIGLESIEETGIPFDPFYHEVLHQIPTDELPDHTVMQVLKKGYMLNKKLIRPALIAVSVKGEQGTKGENLDVNG